MGTPTHHIGKKFNIDGSVRRFPGNTIICHIPMLTVLSRGLMTVRDRVRISPFGHKFTFLPPSSYHMTVFDCMLDERRGPGHWPKDLPADASINDGTKFLVERLRTLDLLIDAPFRIRIGSSGIQTSLTSLTLVPEPESEQRLRALRDAMSERFGITAPDHATYLFHTTVSYPIEELDDETPCYRVLWLDVVAELAERIGTFELGAPEFCTFNDMFAFETHCFIGEANARLQSC
ncbi:DUF1868 domain-containing protein [Paraburkholderia denitrificans]|uniref:DUF1868 domain-containing protein n=1 Tax=Paraburkholderia denitrificans TaxID=694025 RepID=A0ABW0JCC5_9BURK